MKKILAVVAAPFVAIALAFVFAVFLLGDREVVVAPPPAPAPAAEAPVPGEPLACPDSIDVTRPDPSPSVKS